MEKRELILACANARSSVYLLKHKLCGLSDSRYSARVMPNMIFFPEKEDESNFCLCTGIYVYYS